MSKAVSAFDALPAGLDPSTINNEVLRKHGLPPRPHPELPPQLLEQWTRIMAQPTRFIRAELAIDDVIPARSGRPEGLGGMAPVGPADSAPSAPIPLGLAGVVRQAAPTTDYSYPATMVLPNGWCQGSSRSAWRDSTRAS